MKNGQRDPNLQLTTMRMKMMMKTKKSLVEDWILSTKDDRQEKRIHRLWVSKRHQDNRNTFDLHNWSAQSFRFFLPLRRCLCFFFATLFQDSLLERRRQREWSSLVKGLKSVSMSLMIRLMRMKRKRFRLLGRWDLIQLFHSHSWWNIFCFLPLWRRSMNLFWCWSRLYRVFESIRGEIRRGNLFVGGLYIRLLMSCCRLRRIVRSMNDISEGVWVEMLLTLFHIDSDDFVMTNNQNKRMKSMIRMRMREWNQWSEWRWENEMNDQSESEGMKSMIRMRVREWNQWSEWRWGNEINDQDESERMESMIRMRVREGEGRRDQDRGKGFRYFVSSDDQSADTLTGNGLSLISSHNGSAMPQRRRRRVKSRRRERRRRQRRRRWRWKRSKTSNRSHDRRSSSLWSETQRWRSADLHRWRGRRRRRRSMMIGSVLLSPRLLWRLSDQDVKLWFDLHLCFSPPAWRHLHSEDLHDQPDRHTLLFSVLQEGFGEDLWEDISQRLVTCCPQSFFTLADDFHLWRPFIPKPLSLRAKLSVSLDLQSLREGHKEVPVGEIAEHDLWLAVKQAQELISEPVEKTEGGTLMKAFYCRSPSQRLVLSIHETRNLDKEVHFVALSCSMVKDQRPARHPFTPLSWNQMKSWSSLFFTDLHWSSLIFTDLHSSSLIFTDLHWSPLIFIQLDSTVRRKGEEGKREKVWCETRGRVKRISASRLRNKERRKRNEEKKVKKRIQRILSSISLSLSPGWATASRGLTSPPLLLILLSNEMWWLLRMITSFNTLSTSSTSCMLVK